MMMYAIAQRVGVDSSIVHFMKKPGVEPLGQYFTSDPKKARVFSDPIDASNAARVENCKLSHFDLIHRGYMVYSVEV